MSEPDEREKAEMQQLRKRVDLLEQLVEAKDFLLAAYRLQDDRLADRALTRIRRVKEALK